MSVAAVVPKVLIEVGGAVWAEGMYAASAITVYFRPERLV